MRFVVDTNILVSGTLWDGAPARLLDAVENGRATLVLSDELLTEFGEVVARPKLAARLALCRVTPRMLVSRLMRQAEFVTADDLSPPPALRDPKDMLVLAAAIGAKADAIVTGDNDLLELREVAGIAIIRVEAALTRLGVTGP